MFWLPEYQNFSKNYVIISGITAIKIMFDQITLQLILDNVYQLISIINKSVII